MTNKWEMDAVLEQSLTQIAVGKARVESCLLAYPELAGELEPLLRTAEVLSAVPKPLLAPQAKARIEEQVLAAAAANPQLAPARRPRAWAILPRWTVPRWAINAMTLVLALIVAFTTVVGASADAMPDSALYPVKLATEDAWLWLAPSRSEPALHLHLARRRLAEIEGLAADGKFDEAVLDDMGHHVRAALHGAEGLPPALAVPVLDELLAFIDTERKALDNVNEKVPVESQPYLENAVLEMAGVISLAESLRASLSPNGSSASPEPTPIYTPTSVPGLMGVEETVVTSTPVQTPTPSPTPTRTPSPTTTRTSTPEPTAEQRAPAPTATEPPPPPAATEPPPPPAATEPPPPPAATEPPPEPTDKTPPGLTRTPEPPGQTRTPKPDKDSNP